MRALVACALGLWVGSTLLLAELRWFGRRPLAERLRPYAVGGPAASSRGGAFSVESFRDVIGPLSAQLGATFARAFGVDEDLGTRLARVHSPLDATTFRVRQMGWSVAGLAVGLALSVAAALPPAGAALFVAGLPLLGFLVPEQRLATESARWQENLFLELPVVAEQIGMLISAGYSLGAALARVASRGKGCTGRDLARVTGRIRQGLGEVDALREWATVARVDAVDRLVAILGLNRDAGDLGRLIGDEARSIRRDVHRRLVERVERRGQQVWIPVTVATLLPGVVFLLVPFVEALRLFSQP